MPGHVLLDTTIFEALPDNKTKVIQISVFQDLADVRGMVDSGMQEGARELWERFAELLPTLK